MAEITLDGQKVEIADGNVLRCIRRGVDVIQLNLDEGLAVFEDASFDVVLQIDTLQHLRNAEVMLRETARVGRLGIVAFPNFAHWPNRLSIARGRMPVTRISTSLPTRRPESWIMRCARSMIFTGSPISSMKISPPSDMEAAWSTSCTASGMLMK